MGRKVIYSDRVLARASFRRKTREAARSRVKPKHEPSEESYAVDMDQDSIPLSGDDPTSIFMQLAMQGESATMNWDEDKGVWMLQVGDHHPIETATQAEALAEAKRLYL